MKKANTQDMEMMLNGMLVPGDMYNVKVFAQVLPTNPIYFLSMMGGALGALLGGLFQDEFGTSRMHNAYIGFTNNVMNVAVLDDWHIDKLAMTKSFNLAEITKVNLSNRRSSLYVTLWFGKKKVRFTVRKKLFRTDINQQAECVEIIKDYFQQLKDMLKAQKKAA